MAPPPGRTMSKLEYTARELMVSGTNNACISGFAFNPLNLVRARLQVQDQLAPGTYRSLWHSLTTIAKEDGALALWRYGVVMSSFREASYGGMQWGLYTPLKTLWNQTGLPPMVANVATGLSAGIVASAFITPIDLVMIRPPLPPPAQSPLLSCGFTDAARRAIRGGRASGCAHGAVHDGPVQGQGCAEGRPRLPPARDWQGRGDGRAVPRLAADDGSGGDDHDGPHRQLCAPLPSGLPCLAGTLPSRRNGRADDQTKEVCKQRDWLGEGFLLHMLASVVSGTVASILCAPMDLVKSRVMATPTLYRGPVHCFMVTLQGEGAAGLFKGTWANVVRMCPAVIVQLPIMEQMRQLAGLEYFGVEQ